MSATTVSVILKDYLYKLAKEGKRQDGRTLDSYREIEITPGVIDSAEGSAKVKIGNTLVYAGIKMQIGTPYPDTPASGVISTSAELLPIAHPDFEAGPPDESAIELARVVDRGIRESGIVQLDKLCITPNEKVWMCYIDLHIIDHDGNLFDACSLAALAAIYNTTVPNARFELGEDCPLPLLPEPPISCTFVKYGGIIVADPAIEEEQVAEARITVATDEKGDIRAMQKGLNGTFTFSEIKEVIKMTQDKGAQIRKMLKKA
ncbi:MAG: RNA-binding protein [Thermoplasmata archaeon HGW-Thermoplasmata-1]|nr:MAG: RNA-binding protein [Thermoplasmata archaeon HGW-Thermoplasmata-1]